MAPETVSNSALVALLRSRVREAVREEGLRPFAARVGVSHPTIDGIVRGTNALTKRTTVEQLVRTFGYDMQTVWGAAAQFARDNPAAVAHEEGGEERVVAPDRYPNRAKAIEAARLVQISDAAIAEVQAIALEKPGDLEPRAWMNLLQSIDDRLRLGIRPGRQMEQPDDAGSMDDRIAAEKARKK